jgi:hypothetical protein
VIAIPAAYGQTTAMPVLQQNELVKKYCAACHTDANPTGGLSLEKFDAAFPDPQLRAMMVSKIKDGALSAAGLPKPDRATIDALVSVLSAESAGAKEWTVTPTPVLKASIVQNVPAANAGNPSLYRLTLTCDAKSRQGEMQLAWAPADVSESGGALTATVDGKASSMISVGIGEGYAVLSKTLPAQTLTISKLFPGETVVFPFDALTRTTRQAFSACFTDSQ